jgi:antitoxin HicB
LEEHARRVGTETPGKEEALPYHVTVKPDAQDPDAGWIASLDELSGCQARGATPEQAAENLREAMESWLSAAVEAPQVMPPPRRTGSQRKRPSSHSGRFLVRMPSALHEELTRAAEREQVSLNRFVTAQLAASVAGESGSAASAHLRSPGIHTPDAPAADATAPAPDAPAPDAPAPDAPAPDAPGSAPGRAPAPRPARPSPQGNRNLRTLIAANALIMVLAATAAVVLVVLALQRGI